MKDYPISIFYRDEDEGSIADIPDLKYCSAFGETPMKALEEALRAEEAWLETARIENRSIPELTYRPVSFQTG